MNGELRVLVHRLIIALDILYDACKHETAIWHIISDLIEQLGGHAATGPQYHS